MVMPPINQAECLNCGAVYQSEAVAVEALPLPDSYKRIADWSLGAIDKEGQG